ncbi:hypothetical protein M9458_012780, partial [Cirrhinus mrigala]
ERERTNERFHPRDPQEPLTKNNSSTIRRGARAIRSVDRDFKEPLTDGVKESLTAASFMCCRRGLWECDYITAVHDRVI